MARSRRRTRLRSAATWWCAGSASPIARWRSSRERQRLALRQRILRPHDDHERIAQQDLAARCPAGSAMQAGRADHHVDLAGLQLRQQLVVGQLVNSHRDVRRRAFQAARPRPERCRRRRPATRRSPASLPCRAFFSATSPEARDSADCNASAWLAEQPSEIGQRRAGSACGQGRARRALSRARRCCWTRPAARRPAPPPRACRSRARRCEQIEQPLGIERLDRSHN